MKKRWGKPTEKRGKNRKNGTSIPALARTVQRRRAHHPPSCKKKEKEERGGVGRSFTRGRPSPSRRGGEGKGGRGKEQFLSSFFS